MMTLLRICDIDDTFSLLLYRTQAIPMQAAEFV